MIWLYFDIENILNQKNIDQKDMYQGDYMYDPQRKGYWVRANSRTATWLTLKGIPHWTGTRLFDQNV